MSERWLPRPGGWLCTVATAVAVLLLSAGCADRVDEASPVGSEGSDELVVEAGASGGARVFVQPDQPVADGMDALVAGVVGIDEGCFTVELEGLAYPVLWPAGTQPADGDEPAVELPDGTVVETGDEVRGAGGYVDIARYRDDGGEAAAALAGCPAETGEIAVFNPNDPVDVHRP